MLPSVSGSASFCSRNLTLMCLQSLRDKSNELEIKLDKETNMLKAATEQVKNETIKYCLGMMLAFTTAGLGAARLVSR